MGHDVFISYSSKDIKVATEICRALEAGLVRVWMAPRNLAPSSTWPTAIPSAIEGSKLVILVFSKDADASEWVLREIQHAVDCKKRIMPVRLTGAEPARGLRLYVNTLQWIDAFPGPLHLHLPRLTRHSQELINIQRSAKSTDAPSRAAKAIASPKPNPPATASWRSRPATVFGSAAAAVAVLVVVWGGLRLVGSGGETSNAAPIREGLSQIAPREAASGGDCSSDSADPLVESSTKDFAMPGLSGLGGRYIVIDVATLKIKGRTIKLSRVGRGDARGSENLRLWLETSGPTVSCQAADERGCRYACENEDRIDISEKILSSKWAAPVATPLSSQN